MIPSSIAAKVVSAAVLALAALRRIDRQRNPHLHEPVRRRPPVVHEESSEASP